MDLDLLFTPATELAQRIRRRELSPVEVTQAVLERAEQLQPTVHPFLTLDGERALEAARQREADILAGNELLPLHGLPVSIKDLEPTANLRTTFGSKFFEHNVPHADGVVAGRLRAAGAIIIGKTNTPNFGHKDMCDNLLMAATRNPWNLERTSGGSSGGAAAAIASGIGPLAHGSDGAGSIRIPAALCGVFGFKPSFGRVPYWPNPDFWAARSHNGPLTRTVRDAALMLDVIGGPDPRDPVSIDAPPETYTSACEGHLRGLRVAWSVDFGYAAVDPTVRELTSRAVQTFGELGCAVEEATPTWPDPADWACLLWDFATFIRNVMRVEEHPDWIEPSMREQIEHGRGATALQVGQAQLERTILYGQISRFMEPYDLLVTPQMPCAAWAVDAPLSEIEGRPMATMFDHLPFTYPFNLNGWPAASVPCGFTSDGLPVALQIVAPWRQDGLCLRAAAAFEAARPWAARRPSL